MHRFLLSCQHCKCQHLLIVILHSQNVSTCEEHLCCFAHRAGFKLHRKEKCQSRRKTALNFISSYLCLQEPSEQHVNKSFKCFIRFLHPPSPPSSSLCSAFLGEGRDWGGNDPPSSPLLGSLHLACVEVREHVRLRGCGTDCMDLKTSPTTK